MSSQHTLDRQKVYKKVQEKGLTQRSDIFILHGEKRKVKEFTIKTRPDEKLILGAKHKRSFGQGRSSCEEVKKHS
jgi:hypothetical protein